MSKKPFALFAVAIMVIIAIVPMISITDGDDNYDSDDQYESMFFSCNYLGSVEYTVKEVKYHHISEYDCFKLFLKDNVDKIDRFNRLIEDVKNGTSSVSELIAFEDDSPSETEFDTIVGKTVVQYAILSQHDSSVDTYVYTHMKCDRTYVEPTVYTYVIEPGHTLTIKIRNMSPNGSLYWRTHEYGERNVLNEGENSIHVTTTTWIDISAENSKDSTGLVSADIFISGNSAPNSTPYALIVICILITVGVAALMIYAGMKPKWSK